MLEEVIKENLLDESKIINEVEQKKVKEVITKIEDKTEHLLNNSRILDEEKLNESLKELKKDPVNLDPLL